MDAKTLKELGGTVHKVFVPFAGKLWGGGQSVGGDWGFEMYVAPDSDPEKVSVTAYEYLRQIAHHAVAKDLEKFKAETAAKAAAPPSTPRPPAAAKPHPPEPTRVPLDESGEETTILENPTIAHVILEGGMDSVRVFGGNWTKFGVKCYPEPLEAAKITDWKEWPVCKGGKAGYETEGRYALPEGFTKVIVAMKGDKPDKVWKFL